MVAAPLTGRLPRDSKKEYENWRRRSVLPRRGSVTSSTASISWLAIIFGRTRLSTSCTGFTSIVASRPMTRSASRTADTSGVVITIASRAAPAAFLKPCSMPAGASMST